MGSDDMVERSVGVVEVVGVDVRMVSQPQRAAAVDMPARANALRIRGFVNFEGSCLLIKNFAPGRRPRLVPMFGGAGGAPRRLMLGLGRQALHSSALRGATARPALLKLAAGSAAAAAFGAAALGYSAECEGSPAPKLSCAPKPIAMPATRKAMRTISLEELMADRDEIWVSFEGGCAPGASNPHACL